MRFCTGHELQQPVPNDGRPLPGIRPLSPDLQVKGWKVGESVYSTGRWMAPTKRVGIWVTTSAELLPCVVDCLIAPGCNAVDSGKTLELCMHAWPAVRWIADGPDRPVFACRASTSSIDGGHDSCKVSDTWGWGAWRQSVAVAAVAQGFRARLAARPAGHLT